MVILAKISLLGILFLSTIHTGESRHHHQHEKPKRCKCHLTEPIAAEKVTALHTTETNIRITTDNKPEDIAITTKITPVTDSIANENKNGRPLGLPLIPLFDNKKDVKPEKKESSKTRIQPTPIILGPIDNHEIISPTDSAAALKSWVLNHPDNKQEISLRNNIKHSEFPSGSRLNKPLYAQFHSQEHYLSLPQYVKGYNYDINRLIGKNVRNPYHYVANAQESKIPRKIVHLSRVDEHLDKYIPLHQYGISTELKHIDKKTLPRVDVIKNQNIPAYAQTVPLDFQSIHEYRYGDNKNSYNIPISHISINNSPLRYNNSLKNGKWAENQIDLINSGTKGSDSIEKDELGHALLQILSQNGMHITENGMLMDAQGTVSNIQTLNLTPILIGNTLSLRNLLQGKYGAATSDLHTPYLQVVLVTSLNPSKLLGIMPLERTHLPYSIIAGSAHTPHFSLKSGQFKTENVDKPTNDDIKTITDKNKMNNMYVPRYEHKEEIKNYIPQPFFNNININGDKSNIGWRNLGSSLNSGNFYRPNNIDDLPQNLPISRTNTLHDENTLLDEGAPHAGRLFIPKNELRKQVAHILSSDAPELDTTIDPVAAYSRIEIPGLSNLFDFALKSKSVPLKVKSLLELNNEADAQKAASFSGIFETVQNPKVDVLHDVKLTGHVPSVGGETVLTRRVSMPIRTLSVTHSPIYRKSFEIHTIPISYSRVNDLKTKPDSDLPVEELDVSRLGGENQLPEIPPENNNGNTVLDVAENDDDDGDFRIIGGNAATGSGTPLSNKGRSGYVS